MTGKNHRSIEFNAPRRFLGNEAILNYWRMAKTLDEESGENQCELYFVILWETGARIGEVLNLEPNQITWNNEAILIDRMMVLKRRKRFVRDVLIKRDDKDPLAEVFVNYVKECNTSYLLPAHKKFTKDIIPNKHVSMYPIYTRIVRVADPTLSKKSIWPHLIRDQRAFFLKEIRGLDVYELQKWFAWARMEQVMHYVGNPDTAMLASKMGIKEVPKQ